MHVALIARDRAGALETRMANRPAHLEYVDRTGKVVTAGPLLDADDKPCGSLIILEVESMSEARAWADADPYALAGLFDSVELHAWRKVVG